MADFVEVRVGFELGEDVDAQLLTMLAFVYLHFFRIDAIIVLDGVHVHDVVARALLVLFYLLFPIFLNDILAGLVPLV